MQFRVDFCPMDPGSQNVADPTDPTGLAGTTKCSYDLIVQSLFCNKTQKQIQIMLRFLLANINNKIMFFTCLVCSLRLKLTD